MTAWLGAQQIPAVDPASVPERQSPRASDTTTSHKLPLEVAGYFSFRYLHDDDFAQDRFYREYSASLFVSKSIGRWRFHSEFNGTTAAEYDSEGIHLFSRPNSVSIKLDNASLNYNWHDWLQGQVGFLFVPAYWR